MLITDSSGRIVLANTPAEALFGYTRAELLALSVESLIPPRFRATHVTRRQDYTAHPGSRVMGSGVELYGLRKDGTLSACGWRVAATPALGEIKYR